MPIKTITFDLDDTLWPIAPVIERAEERLHAWFSTHYPRVVERFDRAGLRSLRAQTFEDHPHLGHDVTALGRLALTAAVEAVGYPAAVAEQAYAVFWAARNEVDLYPEVRSVLEQLRGNFSLGCISNGNADVKKIGLGDFFDFTICARDAGAAKPDPAIFAAVHAVAKVLPEECVHVGDHLECDIYGAARAGFTPIWLDRQCLAQPDPLRPGYRIARLGELPVLIQHLARNQPN